MHRGGRPRERNRAPLILLLVAFAPACAPIHAKDLRLANLPPATMVAVGPISNDVVSDSTIATRIREAVYLELVKRHARYSVQIQDIAETDKGRGGADIMLQGWVTPRYSTGFTAGIQEFLHGGGEPVRDGRFSMAFKLLVSGSGPVVGRTVWYLDITSGGRVSDSVDELRRGVGARIASELPYKK
jgi:hypothetical protein